MAFFNKFKNITDPTTGEELTFPVDVQQEIEEALYFYMHSGYYTEEEILELASMTLEDICTEYEISHPEASHIKSLVGWLMSNANLGDKGKNNYGRLRKVFDILNKEQIIAIDFAGYTLDDGFDEVGEVFRFMKENDIPRKGYCFYHQQDIERAMDESIRCLYLAFHSMNGDKQVAFEVGKRIVELLVENGFDVTWDESIDSRIMINDFWWDKVFDGEDYGVERAIRVMGETDEV